MTLEVKITRFEQVIQLDSQHVFTLEVNDRHLFTRVVRSFLSGKGLEADEPYQVWRNGKAVSARNALYVVNGFPSLPLTDRTLLTSLYERISLRLGDNLNLSARLQELSLEVEDVFDEMAVSLWGDYRFASHWDPRVYLKAFALHPHVEEDSSLLDTCVRFFGLCADVTFDRALVLVNAKSFFVESELYELFSQAIFYGVRLFLLESWHDDTTLALERKMRVDQDFIEL